MQHTMVEGGGMGMTSGWNSSASMLVATPMRYKSIRGGEDWVKMGAVVAWANLIFAGRHAMWNGKG